LLSDLGSHQYAVCTGAESLNWLVRLSLEGGLDFTSKHFDQDKEALEW